MPSLRYRIFQPALLLACSALALPAIGQGQPDGAAGQGRAAKAVDEVKPEPVRIAVLGDLTRDELAMVRGLRAGIFDVGLRARANTWMRPFQLANLDDRGDSKRAVEQLENALERGRIDLVVGVGRTIQDPALRKFLREKSLPVFAPNLRSAPLPARGRRVARGGSMFGMRAPLPVLARALIDRLEREGRKRFALAVRRGDTRVTALVRAELERRKLSLVAIARLAPRDIDVADAVEAASNGLPDAVLLLAEPRSQRAFVRGLRGALPKRALHFACIDTVDERILVKDLGADAEGLLVASGLPWPWADWLPIGADWLSTCKQQKLGNDVARSFGAFHGYLVARFLERLISEEIGGRPLTKALIPALRSRDVWDLDGVRMTWKQQRRFGHHKVHLSRIVAGELQIVAEDDAAPGK